MTKKILTGSRAFFSGLEGFKPKDSDFVILVDRGNGFRFVRQITTNEKCLFVWVRRPKDELMDYALTHGAPMQLIKFLTPNFAAEIGLEISDLAVLRPLVGRLDSKHAYAKIIYEAYIQNGRFELTEQQRATAFKAYLEARKQTPRS